MKLFPFFASHQSFEKGMLMHFTKNVSKHSRKIRVFPPERLFLTYILTKKKKKNPQHAQTTHPTIQANREMKAIHTQTHSPLPSVPIPQRWPLPSDHTLPLHLMRITSLSSRIAMGPLKLFSQRSAGTHCPAERMTS